MDNKNENEMEMDQEQVQDQVQDQTQDQEQAQEQEQEQAQGQEQTQDQTKDQDPAQTQGQDQTKPRAKTQAKAPVQAQPQAQPAKKGMDVKKIAIIAGVTVLVIVAAIFVDNAIRNPWCEDETAAINVVIQKVLPVMDELGDEEGFALDVQEIESIGNTQYYPVFITRYPSCEDSATARRIVEERVLPGIDNSEEVQVSYLRTESINYDRYYVFELSRITNGKKEIVTTVYVREQNTQPFVKDADGNLVAVADEEEVPLRTAYVRIKDSQPFYRDDTTGQLIPFQG